ncbi:carboxypeptidase-like regulatory domain-containing protein, partial [Acinetobacter baumannii]
EAVTVIVKDSKLATQTRSDGSFSISVPANTKYLNFSAIGYETQQVQLGASLTLAIAMVQTEKSIEDVVVIGYGVTRKTDVTSAIT